MKSVTGTLPKARIPYGTWGSSYFPAWQTSALAEVNIGQFAGEAMDRILGLRRVPAGPARLPGHRLHDPVALEVLDRTPGRELPRAPAFPATTSSRPAPPGCRRCSPRAPRSRRASRGGRASLTFDRTSDSPVGVFPERRALPAHRSPRRRVGQLRIRPGDRQGDDRDRRPGRPQVQDRPAGSGRAAPSAATSSTSRPRSRGFLDRVLVPLDVLNLQGRPLGRIDDDLGVRRVSPRGLRAMRELDTCVTGGTPDPRLRRDGDAARDHARRGRGS